MHESTGNSTEGTPHYSGPAPGPLGSFSLRSIFLATAAVAAFFALFSWIGWRWLPTAIMAACVCAVAVSFFWYLYQVSIFQSINESERGLRKNCR